MAVPHSNISLKDHIGPEVGDATPVSLRTCSTLARPTLDPLPTSMLDFAGLDQSTVPSAPHTALTSQMLPAPAGTARFNLTWIQTSNDETNFRIERRVNGGSWYWAANKGANATRHTDTFRHSGSGTYQFRVRAYNSAGSSAWATSVQVTISDAEP